MTIETAGGGNPKKSDGDKARATEIEGSSTRPVMKFVHGSAMRRPSAAVEWMTMLLNARVNATAASTNPSTGVTIETSRACASASRIMNLRAAATVIRVTALKAMEQGTVAVRSMADGRTYSPYAESYGYTDLWMKPGPYIGWGPAGYQRSDERIREDICERLTLHGQIDARKVEVDVNKGEVTLRGLCRQPLSQAHGRRDSRVCFRRQGRSEPDSRQEQGQSWDQGNGNSRLNTGSTGSRTKRVNLPIEPLSENRAADCPVCGGFQSCCNSRVRQ